MESKFKRVEHEFDPRRCQGILPNGSQCMNVAQEDESYCLPHKGGVKRSAKLRNYRLSKFKERVDFFADNPQLKTLNEEIGVLRMMLEEKINSCKDDADLMMNAPVIGVMVEQIGRLVQSCHALEEKTGSLLSKIQLANYMDRVINVIASEIEDKDKLANIAGQLDSVIRDIEND